MAAGTFFGGLLAASATVTAISITGTLQFRATHPSATDTHGLDGARITLAVTPGPALDDDDSGELADLTLLDTGGERRDMRIEGGVLDGTYASVEQADPSSLERRAASDRITIGAGTFRLDGGLTLRLAGIDLDLPLGTLLGPDARGELGLPDDFDGPATASPGGDGEPGDGDLVVVADDDNLPPIVYALTDIEIETGEDGDAGAPGGGDNGAGSGGGGPVQTGDHDDDTGDGGSTGNPGGAPSGGGGPLLLAALGPDLTQPQDDGGSGSGTPPTLQRQLPTADAQVAAPPGWLLLFAALPGFLAARRRT